MDGNTIFLIILVVVGLLLFQVVFRRLFRKGTRTVERAIRSDTTREEDNLLGTAIFFETTEPLADVRQAIKDNVPVVDKIGHKMKILEDSVNGISWELGMVRMGMGVVAVLRHKEQSGGSIAVFEITQHVSSSAISPFMKQITELREQVIAAFEFVDPDVKMTTEKQEVKYKMSWF